MCEICLFVCVYVYVWSYCFPNDFFLHLFLCIMKRFKLRLFLRGWLNACMISPTCQIVPATVMLSQVVIVSSHYYLQGMCTLFWIYSLWSIMCLLLVWLVQILIPGSCGCVILYRVTSKQLAINKAKNKNKKKNKRKRARGKRGVNRKRGKNFKGQSNFNQRQPNRAVRKNLKNDGRKRKAEDISTVQKGPK